LRQSFRGTIVSTRIAANLRVGTGSIGAAPAAERLTAAACPAEEQAVRARRLLFVALLPYAAWLVLAYRYHFLDGVNLLFHEAGHVFFGILGRTLGVLGGTLGQLVFPVATALHFERRGRRFDAAVCVLWLGESLMYAGVYIADAQRRALPLVNDGIHDWWWLLGRAGLLPYAEGLGSAVHLLASGVVITALVLAARALRSEGEQGRSTGSVAEASAPGLGAAPRGGL
jgi:hypothetical protein